MCLYFDGCLKNIDEIINHVVVAVVVVRLYSGVSRVDSTYSASSR